MTTFKAWLKAQFLSESTTEEHIRAVHYFEDWCSSKNITLEQVDYKTLITYIKASREKGNKAGSINNNLGSIKKYFDFLDIGGNPADKLTVKDRRRKTAIIDHQTLELVYESFVQTSKFRVQKSRISHLRDCIVLGLMIYQAADTATLKKLRLDHIDINKATVYLPETGKSNSRIIGLQGKQMLAVIKYQQVSNEELLMAKNGNRIIQDLFKKVKKINPEIKNNYQVRASVITKWLKESNLREVQYLAGHKYISSTEYYIQKNIETLRNTIVNGHPLSQ